MLVIVRLLIVVQVVVGVRCVRSWLMGMAVFGFFAMVAVIVAVLEVMRMGVAMLMSMAVFLITMLVRMIMLMLVFMGVGMGVFMFAVGHYCPPCGLSNWYFPVMTT